MRSRSRQHGARREPRQVQDEFIGVPGLDSERVEDSVGKMFEVQGHNHIRSAATAERVNGGGSKDMAVTGIGELQARNQVVISVRRIDGAGNIGTVAVQATGRKQATHSFASFNIGFAAFPQIGPMSLGVSFNAASEELLRFDQCSDRDVPKDGRLEERLAACIPPEFRELPLNSAKAGKHFGHSSYVTGLTKDVPQPGHQPFWLAAVDLRIDTVDIARGSLRPVAPALKDEDPVLSVRNMRTVKSETQLDRHIESRNPSGRLNTGQVVDGNIRVLDQTDNRFQPSLRRQRRTEY